MTPDNSADLIWRHELHHACASRSGLSLENAASDTLASINSVQPTSHLVSCRSSFGRFRLIYFPPKDIYLIGPVFIHSFGRSPLGVHRSASFISHCSAACNSTRDCVRCVQQTGARRRWRANGRPDRSTATSVPLGPSAIGSSCWMYLQFCEILIKKHRLLFACEWNTRLGLAWLGVAWHWSESLRTSNVCR